MSVYDPALAFREKKWWIGRKCHLCRVPLSFERTAQVVYYYTCSTRSKEKSIRLSKSTTSSSDDDNLVVVPEILCGCDVIHYAVSVVLIMGYDDSKEDMKWYTVVAGNEVEKKRRVADGGGVPSSKRAR
jgi:hypothetical protein